MLNAKIDLLILSLQSEISWAARAIFEFRNVKKTMAINVFFIFYGLRYICILEHNIINNFNKYSIFLILFAYEQN
jgi:hypothetical protein